MKRRFDGPPVEWPRDLAPWPPEPPTIDPATGQCEEMAIQFLSLASICDEDARTADARGLVKIAAIFQEQAAAMRRMAVRWMVAGHTKEEP
jgi:hypothetical protein